MFIFVFLLVSIALVLTLAMTTSKPAKTSELTKNIVEYEGCHKGPSKSFYFFVESLDIQTTQVEFTEYDETKNVIKVENYPIEPLEGNFDGTEKQYYSVIFPPPPKIPRYLKLKFSPELPNVELSSKFYDYSKYGVACKTNDPG